MSISSELNASQIPVINTTSQGEIEPSWRLVSGGVYGDYYTRPVLGSEASWDFRETELNGSGECTMGLTFESSFSKNNLKQRVLDGLVRLRLDSPLIAASIIGKKHPRSWTYSCASSLDELRNWADETLYIHHIDDIWDPDAFISTTNQTCASFVRRDGSNQHFRCHLLVISKQQSSALFKYSLFFQATHAISDARPTLAALRKLVGWIAQWQSLEDLDLSYGNEWVNLPPGPVSSTGGFKEGWDSGLTALNALVAESHDMHMPTHSIAPQRSMITTPTKPVRVRMILDHFVSAQIIQATKSLGLPVSSLFEAAQVMAIFYWNPVIEGAASAHVVLSQLVALDQFHISPYRENKPFVSAMIQVPLRFPLESLKNLSPKEQLLSMMKYSQQQYKCFLTSPYLAHLRSENVWSPNPCASILTNLGVVDKAFPLVWLEEEGKQPVISIERLDFGHRWILHHPVTHVWTMKGRIHVQVEASDLYDKDYLYGYLGKIIDNAKLILGGDT